MPSVIFTENLRRHIECPASYAPGNTVAEVLAVVFAENPKLKGYVLDDQGRLRKHMLVAVNGELIRDRVRLSDKVDENAEIHVIQALSGG